MAKKTKHKTNLSTSDIKTFINKSFGNTVAFSLREENPTTVNYWISTGSRVLDSIICNGKIAGIPGGKISSISGLSATGKSLTAAHIMANAQKLGLKGVWFDSEDSIDPYFLERVGVNIDELIYVQADSCEFVLETIAKLLEESDDKFMFIWDSLANTITNSESEDTSFNPNASISEKARVMSVGMRKLVHPIANSDSCLLILNQLKDRIARTPGEAWDVKAEPYFTPGGKSLKYAYSLEIWLTRKQFKSSFTFNEDEEQIGAHVKAEIKKSRFGTERRNCTFKIMWTDELVGIQDQESWLDAISTSDRFRKAGAGYHYIKLNDGTEIKFQGADNFIPMLENPLVLESILDIMDQELIHRYARRQIESKEEDEEASNETKV